MFGFNLFVEFFSIFKSDTCDFSRIKFSLLSIFHLNTLKLSVMQITDYPLSDMTQIIDIGFPEMGQITQVPLRHPFFYHRKSPLRFIGRQTRVCHYYHSHVGRKQSPRRVPVTITRNNFESSSFLCSNQVIFALRVSYITIQ